MRIIDLIQFAISELAGAGIEESSTDANLLLAHCLGKSRTELFLAAQEVVAEMAHKTFLEFLARRKAREPLAYILGEREFWSLPFIVNPAVLIPRPETEFVVEQALASARSASCREGLILDLCCGSGVIAIVLALELGRAITAVDISFAALEVTRENCRRHRVEGQVRVLQADLLTIFPPRRMFSLVVTNPPYVNSRDIQQNLEPEVAKFEPHLALDGGEHGLDVIQRIRDGLCGRMLPEGEIFMEIGADQGEEVQKLFSGSSEPASCFKNIQILKDYAGRDRVLHATAI